MSKRAPRLKFTEEELSDPAVKKAAKKANRKVEKLEHVEAKIPKKKVAETEPKSPKSSAPKGSQMPKKMPSIHFEEKKPPSKLKHTVEVAPANITVVQLHRQIRQSEQDNVGVESAHQTEETAEAGVRTADAIHRHHKLRPYRAASQAERKADRANLQALYRQAEQDGTLSRRTLSRQYQKRAIKREYAAAKRAGNNFSNTVYASEITTTAARNARRAVKEQRQTVRFIRRHGKGVVVVLSLSVLLMMMLSVFSSCSVILSGAGALVGSSTYPSRDEEMLAAEAAYCALEDELQEYLDTYEETHDYDEYVFELDDIGHDPYVLISILSALHLGGWTQEEVRDTIQDLFDLQYILTETVTTEDDWTVCTVTLENRILSHIPVLIMDEDQLSVYASYMGTLGNRPDLFPDSEYIGLYIGRDDPGYDVPPEALADGTFAAMIREGEKYLGYPYVWGGSKPSTSFDCSGFVSWVINHSGWNVGRQTAQGLCNLCTPVPAGNARPGDLVFFKGTYNTPGVSHVGIYVGNGRMLHCGDPISYTSINTNYWQNHLYRFGRLP